MTPESPVQPSTERRPPTDTPGTEGENPIAREPLWYAYAFGDDHPSPPAWADLPEPAPETHTPPPPVPVRTGEAVPLPGGTAESLARAPYPEIPGADSDHTQALGRALATCFAPIRREPENPYNDHRGYPSPRCLFPVHAFLGTTDGWWLVDGDRHALVPLAGAAGASGDVSAGTLVLTGRFTAVPRAYKWFRGSLVSLELGIVLRSLCLALDLFGLAGRLRLPASGTEDVLAGLGLTPTWEWSLPLMLDVAPAGREPTAPTPPTEEGRAPEEPLTDQVLTDVVRADRAQWPASEPADLGRAVPDGLRTTEEASSWSELLWKRTSGRMPRGLHGMGGRYRDVSSAALEDAITWVGAAPPGVELRGAHEAVRATVAVQGVAGHTDGVYRIESGKAVLKRADPTAAQRLEHAYGYGPTFYNGCDIRHASAVWFFSIRPRELVERLGPRGWHDAQYACGWATQGLCLAAAAHGLYARPVRAFHEVPTQEVLDLEPEDMLVLAVVTGTERHTAGIQLDLRV